MQGILKKAIGGFYYVKCGDKEYECKARGSFRKSGKSPVAGDMVEISVPNDGFAAIEKILPRKNSLKRPPLANIDVLVIVCSTVNPSPNFTVIDKMTAAAINNDMQPIIVVSKTTLKTERISPKFTDTQVLKYLLLLLTISRKRKIKKLFAGKTSAFTATAALENQLCSIYCFLHLIWKRES